MMIAPVQYRYVATQVVSDNLGNRLFQTEVFKFDDSYNPTKIYI